MHQSREDNKERERERERERESRGADAPLRTCHTNGSSAQWQAPRPHIPRQICLAARPSVKPLTLANFEVRCYFVASDTSEWLGNMNSRQAKIDKDEYEGGVIKDDAGFTIEEVRGHRFVLLANVGAVATQVRECERELSK